MKSSTDRNLNYRYTLTQNPEDVSNSTFQRRLQKKEQSKAKQFIFDTTELTREQLASKFDFLNQQQDPIYLNSSSLQDLLPFTDRPLHIKIQTPQDYHDFKSTIPTYNKNNKSKISLVLSPQSKSQAQDLRELERNEFTYKTTWQFSNFNSKIKNSLTVSNIHDLINTAPQISISEIPFWNSQIPAHYELESLEPPTWTFSTGKKNILISVIIPTFNNCVFLTNVIQHLLNQSISYENYEIIIVDDGSSDFSNETIFTLVKARKTHLNIKYIYWPKINPARGDQSFFRAGLARNLGAQYAEGVKLLFLDADMLVPENFIFTCLNELDSSDLIQFSRAHIQQSESRKNPQFDQVNIEHQTYIEDGTYWNQLFQTEDWNTMTDFWKYTCTYSLGISKSDFFECGRFKRHFVSYGFEDTDIGFRMYKKNKKFKLSKNHLLHLTNYSTMQYRNSKFLRDQLLRKTSKLLFLDNLDPEIYKALHFYYGFEKSIFHHLRDVF